MYRLPHGMRYSTLDERKEFYEKEFDLEGVRNWLGQKKNTVFALIIGRHTNIYPKEYKGIRKNTVVIDDYKDVKDLAEYFVQYLPEAVYYDRGVRRDLDICGSCKIAYKNCWKCPYDNFIGQELVFDIDPENITCPYHGSLGQKMKAKQGLGFCMYEFNEAKKQTKRLYDELSNEFSRLRIVYSGRGFHVHVLDEGAYIFTRKEREKIASEKGKRYAIDEWVTIGDMRLIRLPYSLHGMVSRICLPLDVEEVEGFDPRKDKRCFPMFMKNSEVNRKT
ncbi:MAG: DNA primase [Thermoplasmata archaeon]